MKRAGVTLVELMIALAITLIMMGAVVTLFGNMTTSVTDSRAVIELSERLRSARNQLQLDLSRHTATTLPPRRPEADEGYLELIEGPNIDIVGEAVQLSWSSATGWTAGTTVQYNNTSGNLPYTPFGGPAVPAPGIKPTITNSIMGDCDDVLMLTVRSSGEPFVGRSVDANGNTIMLQSQVAEVAWFALPNGRQIPVAPATAAVPNPQPVQLYTLYRRVLLVLPQVSINTIVTNTGSPPYANTDISSHYDPIAFGTGGYLANTLGDLTKRENRYLHGTIATVGYPGTNPPSGYPFSAVPASFQSSVLGTYPASVSRLGDDVILTDVLAFDVRVYDPFVTIQHDANGIALTPSDPAYIFTGKTTQGQGCFVDMNYRILHSNSAILQTFFYAVPDAVVTALAPAQPTYDTFSTHYEQNGYDEDGLLGIDQGRNGLDDDTNGFVDDPISVATSKVGTGNPGPLGAGEAETIPPYPVPLRGVQITLRVYEPDSRQVRQVSVVQDFIPE